MLEGNMLCASMPFSKARFLVEGQPKRRARQPCLYAHEHDSLFTGDAGHAHLWSWGCGSRWGASAISASPMGLLKVKLDPPSGPRLPRVDAICMVRYIPVMHVLL